MADTGSTSEMPVPAPAGFPFATAIATFLTLFVFLGLLMVAYRSPSYLGDTKIEPKADPAIKLTEVRAKNQTVLDGTDPAVKMSVGKATSELLTLAEKNKGLPFPTEPPPPPPAPPAKIDPKAPVTPPVVPDPKPKIPGAGN